METVKIHSDQIRLGAFAEPSQIRTSQILRSAQCDRIVDIRVGSPFGRSAHHLRIHGRNTDILEEIRWKSIRSDGYVDG